MVFEGFGAAVNGVMHTSLNLEGSGGASLRMSRIPVELIYRVSFRNKDLWLGGAIILEQILWSVDGWTGQEGKGGVLRKDEDKCKKKFICRCQAPIFHYYIIIVSPLAPSRAMTS